MASTTVNFNLKTAGYVNYANQTLTFTLLNAGAEAATGDQSYVTLPGTVTATSAANGDGSVSLFRNGKSGIDSVYEVVFPNRERTKFVIPAGSPTIELATLIVDNVPSGSTTQQSSIYDKAIQRANHTGTQALSTISDAGTIASQASNSVSISGGSISGVTLTASTANLTDATNKRLMTDAQETKLDSVESSADVTDATNVTAAGALMDSEVDADIKTLSLPASTTISTFAKTFLDDADAAAVKTTLSITDPTAQVNFVPRSITFTDASAFLSVADHNNLDVGTGDFSFSFAARVSSASNAPVLQKNGSAGYAVFFDSGALKLTLNASGSSDFTLATGLNDNKWHTYVITVDRDDTAIAYVDNVAQTGVSVSGKAGNLDSTAAFQIGLVGTTAGSGIALGNYLSLHKIKLTSTVASNIYFSPDTALGAPSNQLMVDLSKATKTFSDSSANAFTVATNGTIIFNEGRITSLDAIPIGATTPSTIAGTTIAGTTITASTKFVGAIDGTVGATTPAAVTGTTITANTKFVGAIDGVVGGNTPAAGTFNSISVSDGNITNAGDINCDSISADVAATGLNVIFDGTDTGDNKITLTDNLASALDITESTNSYLKFTTTNSGEKVVLGKDLDISGDHDLIIGTSTGTKIGTAVTQKIGFFNATPVVQPATTGTTGGTSGGSGTVLHANGTITGGVGSTAYTVGDIVKALKQLGLLDQ